MGLRDIGETLPPGFRFYPSDEELVCHYLYKKIANEEVLRGTLVEIDLHICEPWQLPDVAKLNSTEWYFFNFRDRKYATGFRTNRATTSGYWKATGKDRVVLDPRTRAVVGMRKTLVFYRNRAPNGIKTGWIMHEFRLENPHLPPKEDWVLCRVFHKSRNESSTNKLMSSHHFLASTGAATCPDLVPSSPQSNQNVKMTFGQDNVDCFPHHHGQNPNTSLGLSLVDPILSMFSHGHDMSGSINVNKNMVNEISSAKCEDDDYRFIFDFDGSNGMPSSLEDMGFDDENGSVFL